jgi:transposase
MPKSPLSDSESPRSAPLVRDSGKPLAEIARDLGVSAESLRHWARQEEIDQGQREGLTTTEREELRRLRRENRILREEREILKKPR